MYCFGENIFVIEETFCALFLKMFCAFKKTFGIFPKKDFFVLQNNISCKSGNIFCINKDRFYVFKETVGAFFEEKFCGFFRETIWELQKGFWISANILCILGNIFLTYRSPLSFWKRNLRNLEWKKIVKS